MGRLFKIEMKKLQKSTAMLVMVIVAVTLGILSVGLNALLDTLAEGMLEEALGLSGFVMANAMSMGNADIMLMVVILMAVLIGGDFSARTLQTQVAAGYDRFKIILSRYLSGIVAYVILYVLYFAVTVGGVTILYGWGEDITGKMVGDMFAQLGLSTLMAITMLSLYLLFIFLLRTVGGSIGVCVPFMLMGTSILQTVMMFNEDFENVLSFTPFGAEYQFVMYGVGELDILKYVLVCLIWTVVFIGLTFVSFRKSELK